MKRKFWIFGIVGLAFAALGIFFGLKQFEPHPAENAAVASLLNQSMPDIHGTAQPLSQWKGKALVVNFWATWCAPCVDEMPELSALQAQLLPKDIHILGVGIDTSSNIVQFADRYKIAYPLYIAGMSGSDLSRQFGNKAGGLPFTVLIGRDGQIKKTYLGRLKMHELHRDLESL